MERRGRVPAGGELLGDLQQRHGAGAVVVRAVVDAVHRVAVRPQAVAQRADAGGLRRPWACGGWSLAPCGRMTVLYATVLSWSNACSAMPSWSLCALMPTYCPFTAGSRAAQDGDHVARGRVHRARRVVEAGAHPRPPRGAGAPAGRRPRRRPPRPAAAAGVEQRRRWRLEKATRSLLTDGRGRMHAAHVFAELGRRRPRGRGDRGRRRQQHLLVRPLLRDPAGPDRR